MIPLFRYFLGLAQTRLWESDSDIILTIWHKCHPHSGVKVHQQTVSFTHYFVWIFEFMNYIFHYFDDLTPYHFDFCRMSRVAPPKDPPF